MITNTPTDPSIATKQIAESSSNVIGANAVIQAYLNLILATPDIDLSSIPFSDNNKHVITDLPAHQATARQNATAYTDGANSVNSLIISTLSDIIGFSNMFESRYQRLLALANTINVGDNKKTFNQGLEGLIQLIQNKEDNCANVIQQISTFKGLIAQDERNFKADEAIIKATLDGENGIISSLKSTISSINSAISTDNSIIAGAAGGEVFGVLLIIAGVLLEPETGGASTALIAGGVALVGGGVAAQVAAGVDLANKNKELKEKVTELDQDIQIASCLLQASSTVTAMITAIDAASTALGNLRDGWSSLKDDLGQIIDALNAASTDVGSWLIEDLNAANSDWTDAKTLAVSLQANGTITVQNSDVTVYPPTKLAA